MRFLRWPTAVAAERGNERWLLERARRGDSAAFDRLLREQEGALRGFLGRRVAADALEDVLQETRLAAWRGIGGFRPGSHFKAWLYGIAHHKAADWARKRSRELEIVLPPPAAAGPAEQVEAICLAASVLRSLPPDQRSVLELYYYEGLTLAEVAAALDRNLNTVKYHFYQAHATAVRVWAEELKGGSNL